MVAKSSAGGSAFAAPVGCALPFGSMVLCLNDAGKMAAYLALLADLEVCEVGSAELDAACAKMADLIKGLEISGSITEKVCG